MGSLTLRGNAGGELDTLTEGPLNAPSVPGGSVTALLVDLPEFE